MAGLSLDMGVNGNAQGNYSPMTPASASTPTSSNDATKAFGIGSNTDAGPATAGIGAVSTGAVALGLMLFIWYSLPR